MRCLIILLAVLISLNSWGQVNQRWYPSARFPEGECVLVHSPSQGDSYVEKVKPEQCRPEKISYLMQNGTCYAVDAETGGRQFGLKEKTPVPCAPEGSLYSFEEKTRSCWLVDPSGGLKFRARLDVKECRPDEADIVQKFIASGELQGECVETHKTLGTARWVKRLSNTECRPKELSYQWRSLGDLKGDCWEMAENDPASYVNKAPPLKCKPESTIYRFERKSEKSGDCFEVDRETEGMRWAQKTQSKFCAPTSN
jgi:hypothetical protein